MISRDILKSNYLYFTGLLLLVIGLPVSLFLTSLSQFILIGAFFIEGDVRKKLSRFINNKAALIFTGIWLMHIVGLIWTADMHEGIKDIRIKLPLILLPLIISGSQPLSAAQFRYVVLAFVGSVFCGTLISMAVLAGIIHRNIYDIRDIFIFNISHIRFALFTCLSCFMLIWIAFREQNEIKISGKIFSFILMCWLLVFLFIIESVTGLIIFSSAGLILLVYQSFSSKNTVVKIITALILISIPLSIYFTIEKFEDANKKIQPYPEKLDDKTKLGNNYDLDFNDTLFENGTPVWMYVCDKELRESWNKISKISYDSVDERKQPLRFTLVRFLASKGLRKDAEGLSKLSEGEIKSVERGVANVNYQDISSIRVRLLQIQWEVDQFLKGGNPNGHSVTQRFEFWKAAWQIAADNILLGVGTGDMPSAYAHQYVRMKSALDENHRLRAHNQYLAILVAFGIIGLLYFLFALFYPVLFHFRKINFLFAAFFIISILSMLSEDTLETQPGATFIAFFFSIFLFGRSEIAAEPKKLL